MIEKVRICIACSYELGSKYLIGLHGEYFCDLECAVFYELGIMYSHNE
jgi:hypothetical protein